MFKHTKKHILYLLTLSIFLSLTTVLFINTEKSYALRDSAEDILNLTGRFENAQYIILTIGGEEYIFKDDGHLDYDRTYVIEKVGEDTCDGEITFPDTDEGRGPLGGWNPTADTIEAEVDIDYRPSNGSCTGDGVDSFKVNLDSRYSAIYAEYKDAETISFFQDEQYDYTDYKPVEGSNGLLWRDSTEDKCNNLLILSADKKSYKYYDLEKDGQGGNGIDKVNPTDRAIIEGSFGGNQCQIDKTVPWNTDNTDIDDSGYVIAGVFRLGALEVIDPNDTSGPPASSTTVGTTDGSSEQPNCKNGGGELSWIVCPLLGYADGVITYLDNQVNSLLLIPADYYNDPTIEKVWANMRNVAYLLLIPALLIIVIGTAMGSQFLDAYTVKRALPRLVLAIVFIAISLPLLQLLIGTINIVGQGVYGLITSVVDSDFEFSLAGLFDPSFGQGAAVTLAFGGAVITAKIWIVAGLFLAFSVFISIATIFLLLAFRQLLVLALIIIAPLAVLAWIFPSNDKFFKLWWSTLWKLLLLYPLIMGLLAVGRVFAYVVDGVSPGGLVEVVLKLVAYIGPFFLIVPAFKFAGGVFASASNAASGLTQGTKGKLKKAGQQSMAQRNQDRKNYGLYSDNNRVGKALNTLTGSATNFRALSRGRGGIRSARQTGYAVGGAEDLKNDPTFNAHQNDDNYLAALASEDFAMQKIEDDRRDMEAALAIGDNDTALKKQRSLDARQKGLNAARQTKGRNSNGVRQAALTSLAKTGYQFDTGEEGYKQLDTIARSIAGGDEGAHSAIMDESQYHLKNAGRYDLGGINHGAGYSVTTGISKAGLYQLANGKTDSIQAWGAEVAASGDTHRLATHLAELKAMQPNTTGANRDEVNRQIQMLETSPVIEAYNKTSSGRIDPATGAQKQTYERYDKDRAKIDSVYASKWTAAEATAGHRMRDETMQERVQAEARAYERPDPNNM